jgi:transcriptional regulator with XRE-family HTH domain
LNLPDFQPVFPRACPKPTGFGTSSLYIYLRRIRIEQKVSVLTLANMAGISPSHLFYIESKRVAPSIDVAVRLAKKPLVRFDFAVKSPATWSLPF